MPRFNHIAALVFDFDGTLVDASEAICQAFNSALTQFGLPALEDDKIKRMIGAPLKEMFPRAAPPLAPDDIDALIAAYRTVFTPIARKLSRPMPGLVTMLNHFEPHIKCGIATSRISDGAHRILEHMDLLDRFEVIVGLQDVNRAKPHPEPVERVLTLLRTPPEQAVMIGDVPADMEAGKAAGTGAIGIASALYPADVLRSAGADATIDSLDELISMIAWKGTQ